MGQLVWAIELLTDFAEWRSYTGNPDDESERLRWVKMCHRLGSYQALQIVGKQQGIDMMSNQNRRRKRRSTGT